MDAQSVPTARTDWWPYGGLTRDVALVETPEVFIRNANIQLAELEPRTLAKILEAVDVQPTDVVMDLGCGLGYSTAIAARMAEFVVGVEVDADVADEAQTILSEQGIDNAAVMTGPLENGAAKSGPYDVILLQGAVEEVPAAILDQLREGGRIGAIFAEGALGVVRIGRKIDGVLNWRMSFNAGAPVLAGFTSQATFTL